MVPGFGSPEPRRDAPVHSDAPRRDPTGSGLPHGTELTSAPSAIPRGRETLGALIARTEGLQPWRRIVHAACGTGLVLVLILFDPSWGVVVGTLAGVFAGALALDALRFALPSLNHLFFRVFRPLASPREAVGIASSTWYLLALLLTVGFLPRGVAIPTILVLALADPAASYVGRRWGRRRFGAGTKEGSLAFLVVALGVLIPFVGTGVGSAAALAATVAEALPRTLDDNLVIPIATGLVIWSLMPFWG